VTPESNQETLMRLYQYHHGGGAVGPHLFGWLVPLFVVAGFAVLVVWAVRRMTAMRLSPALAPGGGVPHADPAVESARLRYAKGEITREDYLRIAADIGAPAPEPPEPSPEA
jgi:uncharacterized membrane protein